jgi:voltage-gated potassium channel
MRVNYSRRLIRAALVVLTMFATGVIGYHIIGGESHGWMDAIYMTANVLSTVGFREAIPVEGNTAAQVFTVILLFVGAAGLVFATSVMTAFIVEGDLTQGFRSRRMLRAIQAMRNHYIVCGAGATGFAVLRELVTTGRQVVVVDVNDERIQRVQEAYSTVPFLKDDFTDYDVLIKAGVERAAGVVVCTQVDKDLLVTTITARQLNPGVRIVARAVGDRIAERLKAAGADAVVSPALIGGMRMASELVRPSVVSFLDMMLRDTNKNLRVEEVVIPDGSPFAGSTLGEFDAHHRANCLLLATRSADGRFDYMPPDENRIPAGTVLIVMGEPGNVRALADACAGTADSSMAALAGGNAH